MTAADSQNDAVIIEDYCLIFRVFEQNVTVLSWCNNQHIWMSSCDIVGVWLSLTHSAQYWSVCCHQSHSENKLKNRAFFVGSTLTSMLPRTEPNNSVPPEFCVCRIQKLPLSVSLLSGCFVVEKCLDFCWCSTTMLLTAMRELSLVLFSSDVFFGKCDIHATRLPLTRTLVMYALTFCKWENCDKW